MTGTPSKEIPSQTSTENDFLLTTSLSEFPGDFEKHFSHGSGSEILSSSMLSEILTLFLVSKFTSFVSWQKSSETEYSEKISSILTGRGICIISLNLTAGEMGTISGEGSTFQKVLTRFLHLFNASLYGKALMLPNGQNYTPPAFETITFCPVRIGQVVLHNSIVLFKATSDKTGKVIHGYTRLASPVFTLPVELFQRQRRDKMSQESGARGTSGVVGNTTESETESCMPSPQIPPPSLYARILSLIESKGLSIRNLYALGMRQSDARAIYTKLAELGVFVPHPDNNNEKIYFPEKVGDFTEEMLREIQDGE